MTMVYAVYIGIGLITVIALIAVAAVLALAGVHHQAFADETERIE